MEVNVNVLKCAKTDASHCMQTLPHVHAFWCCSDHEVHALKQLFPLCSYIWRRWRPEEIYWLLPERTGSKMDFHRYLILYYFFAFTFFRLAGNCYLTVSLIKKLTISNRLLNLSSRLLWGVHCWRKRCQKTSTMDGVHSEGPDPCVWRNPDSTPVGFNCSTLPTVRQPLWAYKWICKIYVNHNQTFSRTKYESINSFFCNVSNYC